MEKDFPFIILLLFFFCIFASYIYVYAYTIVGDHNVGNTCQNTCRMMCNLDYIIKLYVLDVVTHYNLNYTSHCICGLMSKC